MLAGACSAKAASGRPLYTTVIFWLGNPLLRAGVVGHSLGVRDEQVSDPVASHSAARYNGRPSLKIAEAPPACDEHRHAGDPPGRGCGDVAVEKERVQYIWPVSP